MAGVGATAMLLSACSGGSDEAGSSGTTASPGTTSTSSSAADSPTSSAPTTAADPSGSGASTAGSVDACSLLTDAQVNAASSKPATSHRAGMMDKPGEATCYWNAGGSTMVSVTVITDPAKAKAKHAELKQGLFFNDKVPGPAIGSGSYWRLAGPARGPELVFLHGTTLVRVDNDNPKGGDLSSADEARLRTKVEALGRAIDGKLP
ncbi:hypothetical protein [Yimella lutea]|uniref:hypothetical protein n=1 Tax=Yimella lutea TaxID=587872 RepID=UPI0031E79402